MSERYLKSELDHALSEIDRLTAERDRLKADLADFCVENGKIVDASLEQGRRITAYEDVVGYLQEELIWKIDSDELMERIARLEAVKREVK